MKATRTPRTTVPAVSGHNEDPLQPRDWLLLILPGVIWGASFYFIAEGLEAFDATLIAPMRIFFGFVALVWFPQARIRVERADWGRVALVGVLWIAVPLSLFPFAEKHVSSSVTGMLNGGTPLFAAVVGSLMVKALPRRNVMVGLVVGFFGVLLIAVPTANEASASALGVAEIMLALACYGVAVNLLPSLQQKYGAISVIVRAQVVALVLTAPFAVIGLNNSSFAWHALIAMVVLGVFGTGLAHVLAATLAGKVGGTRTSVTTYIMPVVALVLGAVVRNESIAALSIAGSVIALLGAYIANRSK